MPVSLLTEGKVSGAVQSLFSWFCLCFQRAFKSFDDVWRLWGHWMWTVPLLHRKEKLQVFLPPFLPGFEWCSVVWGLIRSAALLTPCRRMPEHQRINPDATLHGLSTGQFSAGAPADAPGPACSSATLPLLSVPFLSLPFPQNAGFF